MEEDRLAIPPRADRQVGRLVPAVLRLDHEDASAAGHEVVDVALELLREKYAAALGIATLWQLS